MRRIAVITLLLVFILSVGALASNVDAGFGNKYFATLVDVPLMESDVTFVLHGVANTQKIVLDSEGDLTSLGDFKTSKTGKMYSEFGLGYRMKDFVPFVAFGLYNTGYLDETIIEKEGKLVLNSVSRKDSVSGLSLGIRYDKKIGNIGLFGSVAKVPDGWYWSARARYYTPLASLHVGYVGQEGMDNKVFGGFGIAY